MAQENTVLLIFKKQNSDRQFPCPTPGALPVRQNHSWSFPEIHSLIAAVSGLQFICSAPADFSP